MKLRYYAIKRYFLTGNSFLPDNNNYYIWKTMTNFFQSASKEKKYNCSDSLYSFSNIIPQI